MTVSIFAASILPDLASVENATSIIAIVSSADSQSALSFENLHNVGLKKKAICFSGSLNLRPCSDGLPVVIISTLSTSMCHGFKAVKRSWTTVARSSQSLTFGSLYGNVASKNESGMEISSGMQYEFYRLHRHLGRSVWS